MPQRLSDIPDTPTGPTRLSSIPGSKAPIRLSDVDEEMTIGKAFDKAAEDVIGMGEAIGRGLWGAATGIAGGVASVPFMGYEAITGGDPLAAGQAVQERFRDFMWEPFGKKTTEHEQSLMEGLQWIKEGAGELGAKASGIGKALLPMSEEMEMKYEAGVRTMSEAAFEFWLYKQMLPRGAKGRPTQPLPSDPYTVDALVYGATRKPDPIAPDTRFYTTLDEAKMEIETSQRFGPTQKRTLGSAAEVERQRGNILREESPVQPDGTGPRTPTTYDRIPGETALTLEERQPRTEMQRELTLAPRDEPYIGTVPDVGVDPQQLGLNFKADPRFEQGIEALNKPGFLRTAEDKILAREAEQKLIGGKSYGKGQSGAIDPDVFLKHFPNFVRSVVRSASGKLQVLYHGTSKDKDFKTFKANRRGIWLTDDPKKASGYALENDSMGYRREGQKLIPTNTASRVIPVYANIQNPYRLTPEQVNAYQHATNYAKFQREIADQAKVLGHDGIIYPDGSVVVFSPDQIQSALSPSFRTKQSGQINLGIADAIDKAVANAIKAFKGRDDSSPNPFPPASNFERYADLPPELKKAVPDDRPLEQVIPELTKKTDLPPQMKGFWTDEHITKLYNNPLAKWSIDNISTISRKWQRLGEALKVDERFRHGLGITATRYFRRERGGVQGAMESLPLRSKMKVYQTRLDFDNAKILRDMGLQWPTIEMLRQKGLNDAEIKAYQAQAKLVDYGYELTNQARAMLGMKPIERIPGYFPHTYEGSFAIEVRAPDNALIYYTRTHTKLGAELAVRKAMERLKKNPELQGIVPEIYRMEDPTSIGSMVAAFERTLDVMNRNDKRTRLVEAVFTGLSSKMNEGLLRSSLQRHGIKGWTGEGGINWRNYRQIAKAQDRYFDAVIEYGKNAEILSKVDVPLEKFRDQIKELNPNAWEYTHNLSGVARNKEVNNLEAVDKFIKAGFDKVTFGQFGNNALNGAIGFFRNLFTQKAIGFFSPSYLIANFFQPHFMGFQAITREWGRIGRGNPVMAMLKMGLETIAPSPENLKAVDWAVRNKVVAPKLMEEIDFVKGVRDFASANFLTGRMTAEAIEGMGRLKTFLLGTEFYRSTGLSEELAMKAAAKLVDDVMINYEKRSRPHMFTNFGMAGQSISQFAVFRNNQFGQFLLAMKALKDNPGVARKVLPPLHFATSAIFFGGMRGMVFLAEYEALAALFNKAWTTTTGDPDGPAPSVIKTLMKNGSNDFWLFGGISSATKAVPGLEHGADIGSSMQAAELTSLVSAPGLSYMGKLGIDAVTFLKWVNGTATKAEIQRMVQNVTPNSMIGFVERAFTGDSNVVPDIYNRGKGSVQRTEADWNSRKYLGKRSITEERTREVSRYLRKEEAALSEAKKGTIDLAADYVQAGEAIPPELFEYALKEGMWPTDFVTAVIDAVKARDIPSLERQQMGTDFTLNRQRKIQRVDELQGKGY